jgi:hypothetical protein
MQTRSSTSRNGWALIAALALPLLLLPLLPPVAQDPHYHAFADSRAAFGIPNFGNVASNAAFFIVGIMGLHFAVRGAAAASWLTFFAAVALVAFGSSYYHLEPGDERLVWDRLPMTLAFMALFTALLSEHVDVRHEGALLVTALAVGVASIVWWRTTGDLKLYIWVQVAPFLAIVVLLTLYPGRYTGRGWLAYGAAAYALAKVVEFSDARVFEATSHAMSGHTLKHLLAALAPLCLCLMLKRRRPTVPA